MLKMLFNCIRVVKTILFFILIFINEDYFSSRISHVKPALWIRP